MKPPLSNKTQNTGFALVIALSLMAFVLLLLLSIVTLVQVETRSSATQVQLMQARSNARLGIFVALGELQKYAGRDQSISAQAALLDTDPTTAVSDGIEHPFWTGIWDVRAGAPLAPAADYANKYANWARDFRTVRADEARWLISGNQGKSRTDPNYYTPDQAYPPTVSAVAVYGSERPSPLTNNAGDSVEVQVPLQPILDRSSQETGSYAFWVSDEGVKAKANFEDPFQGETDQRAALRSLTPANVALPAIGQISSAAVSTSSGDFGKLNDASSLRLISGVNATDDDLEEIGHDITFYSKSIAADVRHGGLKKDLSAAFTDADEFTKLLSFSQLHHQGESGYGDPVGQIFPPQTGTSATDQDAGGPRWEQLKSYFDLAGGTRVIGSQTDSSVGLSPVIARAQVFISGKLASSTQIQHHLLPAVVLWNPYNIDLPAQDYIVAFGQIGTNFSEFGSSLKYMETWSHPQAAGAFASDVNADDERNTANAIASYNIGNGGFGTGGSNLRSLLFKIEDNQVIPAGRAVIYSPSGISPYNLSDPQQNVLTRGVRGLGGAFYADLPTKPAYIARSDLADLIKNDVTYKTYQSANNAVSLYKYTPSFTTSGFDGDTLGDASAGDLPILQQVCGLSYADFSSGVSTRIRVGPTITHPNLGDDILDVFGGISMQLLYGQSSTPRMKDQSSSLSADRVNGEVKWLGNLNPRARFSGPSRVDSLQLAPAGRQMPGNHMSNPSYDLNQGEPGNGFNIPGIGNYAELGDPNVDTVSLFEVPNSIREIQSIGQLMHANLFKQERPNSEGNITSLTHRDFVLNRVMPYGCYANLQPAYPIGNSLADPKIRIGQTYADWSGISVSSDISTVFDADGIHYDYSYLLNDALWDRYFLSGLSLSEWSDLSANSFYLPNQRMELRDTVGTIAPFDAAASKLMIDGAFNVNSVSVDAWAAFIGGFLGVNATGADGSNTTVSGSEAFYSRLITPMTGLKADVSVGSPESRSESYTGHRTLSIAELQRLATAIVEEVKERGPFLSMSDFVNRRLDPENNQLNQLKGALQEAIDGSQINGNLERAALQDVTDKNDRYDDLYNRSSFPEEATSRAFAVPGHLTQADLLARTGSVMQVRSDTFRIRAYGQAVSTMGAGPSVAVWCEAIVQRTPDYINDTDAPEVSLANLTQPENGTFGRRFEIVSFRWLSKDEI